ncbi:hypothetical protein AAFP32_02250 [Brevibacterium sp. CBA3109]|uniref:Uncharacterized protein n=1 Tax=Brevibacterium koreense TaxID=3140787 RepID=A0AAU7UN74_9MICO
MQLTATPSTDNNSPDQSTQTESWRRATRWFALVLALVCAAVLSGGLNARSAQADESSSPGKQLGAELGYERADSLADKVDLESASKSGEDIDASSAKAWELDDGNIYVNYSFNSDIEGVSNIGAVVSPEGKVLATAEIVMKATSEDSGHVEAWNNGTKTADRDVTAEDAASNRASTQSDGFWGKLNDCLSSQGISSWVVAGISVACSAVCVGTAGVGCVGCIAAAAGVTGGVAGYCIDQAQK